MDRWNSNLCFKYRNCFLSKFNAYFVQRLFSVWIRVPFAFRAVILKHICGISEYFIFFHSLLVFQTKLYWKLQQLPEALFWFNHRMFCYVFSSKIQSTEAMIQASQTLSLQVSFWRKCHIHSSIANESYVACDLESCKSSCLTVVIREDLFSQQVGRSMRIILKRMWGELHSWFSELISVFYSCFYVFLSSTLKIIYFYNIWHFSGQHLDKKYC